MFWEARFSCFDEVFRVEVSAFVCLFHCSFPQQHCSQSPPRAAEIHLAGFELLGKQWRTKALAKEVITKSGSTEGAGAIAPKFPLVAVLGFEGCTSVRQVRGTAPALFPADLARLAHAHGAAGHQLQRGGEGAVLGLLDTLGQRGLRVPQLHGHGLLEDDGPGIHLLLQRQQGTGEVALVTKFLC